MSSHFLPSHEIAVTSVSRNTARLFGPGGILHGGGVTTAPAPVISPGTPVVPGTPAAPAAPHPLLTKLLTLIQNGAAAGFPKIKSLVTLLISSGILGTSGSGLLNTLLTILTGLTTSGTPAAMETHRTNLESAAVNVDWHKLDRAIEMTEDADEKATLEYIKKGLSS